MRLHECGDGEGRTKLEAALSKKSDNLPIRWATRLPCARGNFLSAPSSVSRPLSPCGRAC
jgi:hypothetical protein